MTPSSEQPEHKEARRLAARFDVPMIVATAKGRAKTYREDRTFRDLTDALELAYTELSKAEQERGRLEAAERSLSNAIHQRDSAERELERLREAGNALLPHLTHTHDYTSPAIPCRACIFAGALLADTQREP